MQTGERQASNDEGRRQVVGPRRSASGVAGDTLVILSLIALAWTAVVVLTGGFTIHLGSVRIPSRSLRNPLLLALLSGLAGLTLRRGRRTHPDGLRLLPAVFVALVGAGLQIYQWAVARPLWLDEQMIALNIRERPLADLAGRLWLDQSAPFGWLAAQRAAFLSFGSSEQALRFVPLLFGVAVFGAALWIGRRWLGAAGALILLVLCVFGQWVSHYSLELKHYSADIFWALLLPALAAWAVDERANGSARLLRRATLWWIVAAIGLWFGNGAMLVAPGVAVVLTFLVWRRAGLRTAALFALMGGLWLASFGAHYLIAIRHALNSPFLTGYWTFAVPPESAGLLGALGWLGGRFEPFAVKPGGSGQWMLFWTCAAGGWVLTRHRALALMMVIVPLSAFVLAALRLVPFFERLSLWTVPAFYVGVALLADVAVRLARPVRDGRDWIRFSTAVLLGVSILVLSVDVALRGRTDMRVARPADSNHQLNDRAGVRWLMGQRVPGDVVLTTRLALPALWWYGGREATAPVLEMRYVEPSGSCEGRRLPDALRGRTRVLVYLGFRFDDVPRGFDDLLLEELGTLGILRAHSRFGEAGRAAIFDLRAEAEPRGSGRAAAIPDGMIRLAGCIAAAPASLP